MASVSPATHSIVVTKTEFRGPPRIRDLSADFVLSWGQAQARVCKLSLNPDLQVLGASVCQVGDVVGNEYSSSRILQTHLDFGLTTMLRCPTTASILQLIDPLIHPKSSHFSFLNSVCLVTRNTLRSQATNELIFVKTMIDAVSTITEEN